MENITKKMIDRINRQIERLAEDFAQTQRFNETMNARIDGMIDMLVIVTRKEYYIDTVNNCLAEREDKDEHSY